MEIFESNNNYVLLSGDCALFCERSNGSLQICHANKLNKEWNPSCLGKVVGLIGKLKLHPDGPWYLLFIRNSESVGNLPDGSEVFKITRVAFLTVSLESTGLFDIEPCNVHATARSSVSSNSQDGGRVVIKALQNTFKNLAMKPRGKAANVNKMSSEVIDREQRERAKFEIRMQEELIRLFEEDGGFYYSTNGDITNSQQIQHNHDYREKIAKGALLWERVDEQYFWNKDLLLDLLKLCQSGLCSKHSLRPFVLPIMQGYVETSRNLTLTTDDDQSISDIDSINDLQAVNNDAVAMPMDDIGNTMRQSLCVWIISRRSKYQSGVRFRRRGVDQNGYVANFVETEQILKIQTVSTPHYISFVQIRGSIPVYWSQPGLKYKPPIRLDKNESENIAGFAMHMDKMIKLYGNVATVSLVNTGVERSEKKISDAFLKHLLLYNSAKVTHVIYDFHDYCSGTNFDNLSILLQGVRDILKDMRYCWADDRGIISTQAGVFRVNCLDCLDRTNVVQALFAVVVLETQLRKLGLLYPDETLPVTFQKQLANMWGNNGDAISTQYAGTIAMKGDYTRTGERTATGLMRDGISSMSRYYQRFRDISKQAGVDILIQNKKSHELEYMKKGSEDTSMLLQEKEENIKFFIQECKKLCLQPNEECITEAILLSCDERERDTRDMNTVVLITSHNYYIISNIQLFPNRTDQILGARIPIAACESLEIGLQPTVFRTRVSCLRLFFHGPKPLVAANSLPNSNNIPVSTPAATPYFLTFRQPNLRLFNNILQPVRDEDDSVESLRAICASFLAAAAYSNYNVSKTEREGKLDRLKYRPVPTEYLLSHVTAEMIYGRMPHSVGRRQSFRQHSGASPDTNLTVSNKDSDRTANATPTTTTTTTSTGFIWPGFPKMAKDKLQRMWPMDIGSKLGFRNSDSAAILPPTTEKKTEEQTISKENNGTVESGKLWNDSRPRRLPDTGISESDDEFMHQVIECDCQESDDEIFPENNFYSVTTGEKNHTTANTKPSDDEKVDKTPCKASSHHQNRAKIASTSSVVEQLFPVADSKCYSDSECDSAHNEGSKSRRRVTSPPHMHQFPSGSARAQTLASIMSVQHRCQRLSRELSQDQKSPTDINAFHTTPHTTDTIREEEIYSKKAPDNNTEPKLDNASKKRTMKISFSETSLHKHTLVQHSTTTGTGENLNENLQTERNNTTSTASSSSSWSAVIRLPDINIPNERLVARLVAKRVNQLLEIDNMRKSIHGGQDLKTKLIVF